MALPPEKLASSLEALKKLQDSGVIAIRSSDLTRTHRERLLKNGFLEEVMKGWYIPSRPEENAGESTTWYASYWAFCASYLSTKFGVDWCLSPEQSIAIHTGNMYVPPQLLVRSSRAGKKIISLPHNTSLLDVKTTMPATGDIEIKDGLRIYPLPMALVSCSPNYFKQNPTDARTALSMIKDASELLSYLLGGGHSTKAGRLIGALRNLGRDRLADDILKTMQAADYTIKEIDPFDEKLPRLLMGQRMSPTAMRIKLMWQKMREDIIGRIPPPTPQNDIQAYLSNVDDIYITDAYHSLSIEGYRVTEDLIDRVRSGDWNPDGNQEDRLQRDAMAARGYWEAFKAVRESVQKTLEGQNAGDVADLDHGTWYREMFAPSVTAGLIRVADLAGYRNAPVFIRGAQHVPPSSTAVRDAMPVLFELLKEEPDASVRIVLGHFIFVYIHPYLDGNGRTGRFLMNVMMASGGYPWTIIPVERRDEYMSALEAASVQQNIVPFTELLAGLLDE